jgi:hypothetical protein
MSPLKEVQTNNKILDVFIWAQKAGVLSILMPCFICYIFLTWIEQDREEKQIEAKKTEDEFRKCTNNLIYVLTNQVEASTRVIKDNSDTNKKMLEYLEKHD